MLLSWINSGLIKLHSTYLNSRFFFVIPNNPLHNLASSLLLFKNQYAKLSHFKSKGILVFLTQKKGQALRVYQKISTHTGCICLIKPCFC